MKKITLLLCCLALSCQAAIHFPATIPSGSGDLNATITPAFDMTSQFGIAQNSASGVSPLAVAFDAKATTCTTSSNCFHDLLYKWDFGDPNATAAAACTPGAPVAQELGPGQWACGSKNNTTMKSKNVGRGAETAHVYECNSGSSCTYTACLTAVNGSGADTPLCKNITVTDPNVAFPTTSTTCVSTSGTFTGCPSGATQVTSSNAVTATSGAISASSKRILYRRGETFTAASAIAITSAGPGIIGAYGTGAKPLFNCTVNGTCLQPQASLWSYMDLQLDGNSGSNSNGVSSFTNFNNNLFLRLDVRNVKFGWNFSVSSLGTNEEWDGFFVVDSTLKTLIPNLPNGSGGLTYNGGNGMYLCAKHLALLGNHVDTDQGSEHGIRTCHSNMATYQHNTIEDIVVAKAFLSIRSPGLGSIQLGNQVTQYLTVSDNWTFGGATTGTVGTGPTNGTATGQALDEVWERNYIEGSATTNEYANFQGRNITARNNIFKMPGGGGMFTSQPLANSPVPTNIWGYNNTAYGSGSSSNNIWSIIQNETGDMTASVAVFQNNLVYTPAGGTGSMITNLVGMTVTTCSTCNTAGSERPTSPLYPTNPPVNPADYCIANVSSYGHDRGTTVPVWEDYFGNAITGTRDIGICGF